MKNGKFVAQERSPALIDGVITDTVRFICLPSFRKIEKKTEIMEKNEIEFLYIFLRGRRAMMTTL